MTGLDAGAGMALSSLDSGQSSQSKASIVVSGKNAGGLALGRNQTRSRSRTKMIKFQRVDDVHRSKEVTAAGASQTAIRCSKDAVKFVRQSNLIAMQGKP